ncbi:MAG: hypothetical protein AB1668_03555, partial [Nanoarchaeota archaeon]
MKVIVVTGGVLSGLGKGVAAASIGKLLSSNLRVIPIKLDGYLNVDPGTMNPHLYPHLFFHNCTPSFNPIKNFHPSQMLCHPGLPSLFLFRNP